MNASIGTSSGQYPSNQVPSMCIDFNSTTKYLNYGTGIIIGPSSNTAGVKTGFYTVLSVGAAVVNSLQMQTANDFPARDPITCTLEGSNATGAALSIGSSWTLLYNGSTGVNATLDPGRYNWTKIQRISPLSSFTAYRFLVTSQRSSDTCVQYSEFRLYY